MNYYKIKNDNENWPNVFSFDGIRVVVHPPKELLKIWGGNCSTIKSEYNLNSLKQIYLNIYNDQGDRYDLEKVKSLDFGGGSVVDFLVYRVAKISKQSLSIYLTDPNKWVREYFEKHGKELLDE